MNDPKSQTHDSLSYYSARAKKLVGLGLLMIAIPSYYTLQIAGTTSETENTSESQYPTPLNIAVTGSLAAIGIGHIVSGYNTRDVSASKTSSSGR